jgi:hypothetical protein
MKTKQAAPEIVHPKPRKEYPCTDCGGDAYIGYPAGRRKTESWGGLVKKGERLCLACGRRRGIKFF